MIKCFTEKAWEDYTYWFSHDKKKVARIHQLLKNIDATPYSGIGKPEPLKENLSGFWSRRINDEHRIVYVVEKETVVIISCRGHYN